MATYAALWCKSNYSFLHGASHPEELVDQAHALGVSTVAITDRNGLYGVVRAHVQAKAVGIKLIIGAELGGIVLLATSRDGYANLCRLITHGHLRSKNNFDISIDDVCAHQRGLIALWATDCVLPQLALLSDAFADRLYIIVARHHHAGEMQREATLRRAARWLNIPTVAAVEVLYHHHCRRPLQDVLTCIRANARVQQAGTLLKPNHLHALVSPVQLMQRYSDDLPSIARTLEVAQRCQFSLCTLHYRYPAEQLPSGQSSTEYLSQLTLSGARARYDGTIPHQVEQQLYKELALIDALDYPGYFLTMWEVVQFCRAQHILCQGRGSAANSAVCYCLGITAVDPMKVDLLFERFLSLERADPPDIDLDIEHDRREEVIQFVYQKYGRDRAAMVANVIRYRTRSAIRDVGKALGLSETALGRLSKISARYEGDLMHLCKQEAVFPDVSAQLQQQFVNLVQQIQGFPRHLSIHPGGFLLGHEPVIDLVPVEPATMPNRTIIQWDKDDIEALGLFKVDLLGLGALTLVHYCFDLLKTHKGIDLSLATLPAEDKPTYEMLCRADTIGVFQIESRAQMSMLPRLRPQTFYDLVIQISIVRPGPISGDMVHPYLRRRHGKEAVIYPHPCLKDVLAKTLGVPLFQEQVIKLAMVAADYTPGEADQLRRDMAAWRRSGRIERHREQLIARMEKKGIAPEFAERIFEQIKGFGEYGFPESHAASFALIAYATAWLKCHHADVFTCALLNAQPMGFYSVATIVEDAKRHHVQVVPIDVNDSAWDCTLTAQNELRMGLRYVKGLGEQHSHRIVTQRQIRPYVDLSDFVRRSALPQKQLCDLATAGALDSFQLDRRQALWQVRRLYQSVQDQLPLTSAEPEVSFPPVPALTARLWDHQLTQHSPRGHLMGPLRAYLTAQKIPTAIQANALPNDAVANCVGLVICRQRPGTANGVVFLTLEDETGFINVVIWHHVFERHAVLIKTAALLGISGKMQRQDGVVHLIAQTCWKPQLDIAHDPIQIVSYDFH